MTQIPGHAEAIKRKLQAADAARASALKERRERLAARKSAKNHVLRRSSRVAAAAAASKIHDQCDDDDSAHGNDAGEVNVHGQSWPQIAFYAVDTKIQ